MSKAKPVRLGGLLVLATVLAVLAGMSWGHLQAGSSEAGGSGTMEVDCDTATAGIQAECSHGPGTTFDVAVIATPGAGGVFGLQVKLAWVEGTINYTPAKNPATEASWGSPPPGFCGVPARSVAPDNVLFGCIPFPLPTTGIADVGTLTFSMACKTTFPISGPNGLDGNQSSLTLVPRAGDPQQGSHFLNVDFGAIEPTLSDAVVTCEEQPPTPTPTPGGPTPTPTTPPSVDRCGATGCTAFDSGDATIEVGDSTVLTFLVTGLDETTPAAGVECTFSVVSGDGTVDPATGTSDADGLVSTTLTAGDTVGTVQVQADCGVYGSSTLGVDVAPILPGTGLGDSSDNGLSTSIWSIAGALLAAAVAGLGFFGWRYARTDRRV